MVKQTLSMRSLGFLTMAYMTLKGTSGFYGWGPQNKICLGKKHCPRLVQPLILFSRALWLLLDGGRQPLVFPVSFHSIPSWHKFSSV